MTKEPEPILKLINRKADYMNMNGSSCPAVVEFLRDVYVVRAPFNFELTINENGSYKFEGPDVPFQIKKDLGYSRTPFSKDKPFTFTTAPNYLIYSNDDVVMECLPPLGMKNKTIHL